VASYHKEAARAIGDLPHQNQNEMNSLSREKHLSEVLHDAV
jgi:hypothetical protein